MTANKKKAKRFSSNGWTTDFKEGTFSFPQELNVSKTIFKISRQETSHIFCIIDIARMNIKRTPPPPLVRW
jgi:hypothetical protein